MKKKAMKTLAVIISLFVLSGAFPLSAAALDHNLSPIDYNDRELGYNTSNIKVNDGFIWQNKQKVETNTANGTIHNNAQGSYVDVNNGRIGSEELYNRTYGSAGNGGYVTTNNGVIDSNFESGTVLYNNGRITGSNSGYVFSNAENGYIDINCGLFGTNKGTVDYNNPSGDLYGNEGLVAVANTGTIRINTGTIQRNGAHINIPIDQTGYVWDNRDSGLIVLNDIYSEVRKNSGTITTNKGYVRNYEGGVVTNNSEGGRVYNYGGTVTNNSGSHYIQVDMSVANATVAYGEGFSSDNGINCWLLSGESGTAVITPDEDYEIKPIAVGSGVTSAVKNNDGSYTVTVGGLTKNTTAVDLGIETAALPDSYTVTVKTGVGDDIVVEAARGASFFEAMDAAGVFAALEEAETEDIVFRDLATKPLSEFADEEEYGDDASALLSSTVSSDMTVYAGYYTKIKSVSLSVEKPVIGSSVTLTETDEGFIQTPSPVITLSDGAHCRLYEGKALWSTMQDDGSFDAVEGEFNIDDTYYADFILEPDFGYWLDENTEVTVNGAKVEEFGGRMSIYVVISTKAAAEPILGDANGDGAVTVLDATVIQRYMAKLSVPDEQRVKTCGDVNGGGLSILDATAIQRHLAKLTAPEGIGQPIA